MHFFTEKMADIIKLSETTLCLICCKTHNIKIYHYVPCVVSYSKKQPLSHLSATDHYHYGWPVLQSGTLGFRVVILLQDYKYRKYLQIDGKKGDRNLD